MPYAEVFDRDRVLAQLESSRAAIEKHLADGGRPMQVDGETASEEELREVLPEIEASLERERTRSGGMQAEGVYLPSDPLISCLQSGVDRGIAERTDKPSLADLVKESDGDLVEGMAGRDGPLPPVTDLHIPPELEEEEAEIDVEPGSYKPFPIDPGWAIVAITISLRALRGKYPYNPKPAKQPSTPQRDSSSSATGGRGLSEPFPLAERCGPRSGLSLTKKTMSFISATSTTPAGRTSIEITFSPPGLFRRPNPIWPNRGFSVATTTCITEARATTRPAYPISASADSAPTMASRPVSLSSPMSTGECSASILAG